MVKVNPKRQFYKDCLFEALMILMRRKDYREITVTELTKVAGVSRMAFYRNYHSIDAIITDYMEEHLFGSLFNIGQDHRPEEYDLRERVRTSFSFFFEHKELLTNLHTADLENLIFDILDECFRGTYRFVMNDLGFYSDYEISALVGLVYKILIDWARNGMQESVDDMAAIGAEIITHFGKSQIKG